MALGIILSFIGYMPVQAASNDDAKIDTQTIPIVDSAIDINEQYAQQVGYTVIVENNEIIGIRDNMCNDAP